jgi:GH24 family phage-related lysozyme (muramidase)
VPYELSRWVYETVDGKKRRSSGLERRRFCEAALYERAKP